MAVEPHITHADVYIPNKSRQSEQYSVPIEYSDNRSSEEYGPVEERGTKIKLSHPVDEIERLFSTTHLQTQLHVANRKQWDTLSEYPNDGTELYDLLILEAAEEVLNSIGILIDELEIPNRRFRAILVALSRELTPCRAVKYLRNVDVTRSELGYETKDDVPSYDTFHSEMTIRLPRELGEEWDIVREACIQAVFAVYRNGLVPPDEVMSSYGFDRFEKKFDEKGLRRCDEQQALINWIRFLADNTLTPLTFGRERPQFSHLDYLGLFATSALTGSGLQSVPYVSDWNLDQPSIPLNPGEPKFVDIDRSSIPKGSGLPKYIAALPLNRDARLSDPYTNSTLPSITEQFDAVHQNTLSVAQDLGFFSNKSVSLAADMVKIEWSGKDNELTIDRPEKDENDVRSEWTFSVVSILNVDARFTLGTRWLRYKSEYPDSLDKILSNSTDYFGIDTIYADKEIVSGDLIETLSSYADESYIVRAPNHKTVKILQQISPKNCVGYVQGISWNCKPKPNLIAYPYDYSNPKVKRFSQRQIDWLMSNEWSDASDPPKSSTKLSSFTSDPNNDAESPSPIARFEELESYTGIGSKNNYATYFTNRSLSEHSASGVHADYTKRWGVEENINEILNNYLPRSDSGKAELRLYGFNIAILLQNWHTLINRAPSPELGIRLSINNQQLLKAIQYFVFSESE